MAAPPVAPREAAVARLVDTHAHLTDHRYASDLDDVLARARDAGVVAFIVAGYDINSSRAAVSLAQRYPEIWATVGIHPHHAGRYDDASYRELDRLAREPRVVAIGECGLDFYRNLSPAQAQREAFAAQMSLASDLDLPVIIHSREAMDQTLDLVTRHSRPRGGVMHCFDGNDVDARRAIELGLHVSAAGPLTYRQDRTLARALASAPADRVLIETDCPYLSPAGYRGQRNEPAHVRLVAEALAQARATSLCEVATQTTQNAIALFNITIPAEQFQEHAA